MRRGQTHRTSAPLVILLIGLVLILYVLFLPPEMREEILSGTPGGQQGGGYPPGYNPGYPGARGEIILQKFIGTVTPLGAGSVEHAIPTATVYTAINTEEIKFIDSMLVKRSAFTRQEGQLSFRADPSLGRNYLLTFNVDEAKGPLIVSLNGNIIFERFVTSRSPEPIRLPQEFIEAENTVTFTTISPGWAFWDANRYRLRNVLVSGDILDFSGATASQHFTITPDEHEQVEKGVLELIPQCDPRQGGRLSVQLNGQMLYAGLPDCGVPMSVDIPRDLLRPGDNSVTFISNRGSYLVERVRVVTQLEEQHHSTYYFNLPPDMFQQLNVFAGRLILTLRFSEGNELKRGVVVVNGYKHAFETRNFFYQATIDPNVLIPNANALQILPQQERLDIAELRVEIVA